MVRVSWSAWGASLLVSLAGPLAHGAAGAEEGQTEAQAVVAPEAFDEPLDRGVEPVLFHTGLYLTVIGTATFVGGLLFTAAGPGEYCPNCPSSQYTAVGYAALLGGFVMGATGGALVVLGSRDDDGDEESESEPQISIGPGGAAVRWVF
ncbi:MAG: hypothetical protein JRI23_17540 [Deltaproteobacteria bacterium]|jgi:hypothetical protein|nr:hypothetical protein [Deltaproteobacteria bacterium]MBW2533625.1 hypothetical protein [Deltaproteobacteria bacterium]